MLIKICDYVENKATIKMSSKKQDKNVAPKISFNFSLSFLGLSAVLDHGKGWMSLKGRP